MAGSPLKLPGVLTLDSLEKIYFEAGSRSVEETLTVAAPKSLFSEIAIIRESEGQLSVRPEILKQDAIEYRNYSPMPLWGVPISFLKMQLQPVPKENSFVFHSGEEIVVPLTGRIRYSVMWSPGNEPPRARELNFVPGEIAAINPSLPHHGWALGESPAEAWLLLYHPVDSSAAFDVAATVHNPQMTSDRKRFSTYELQQPGTYSLVAWGIADRVRTQRQRFGITIHQMAELINIDASHLSRLENASTNPSLDALFKVCEFLRIDLRTLLTSTQWMEVREVLDDRKDRNCLLTTPHHPHKVHACQYRQSGGTVVTVDSCPRESTSFSIWSLQQGQAILEHSLQGAEKRTLLTTGDVIHLRTRTSFSLRALDDCSFIEFHLGSSCPTERNNHRRPKAEGDRVAESIVRRHGIQKRTSPTQVRSR